MGTSLFRTKLNMIMFRGKLTVSPNTLNNEIHTYFFAQYWQKMNAISEFRRKNKLAEETIAKLEKMERIDPIEPPYDISTSEFGYKKWMELIKNVSEFNRFYVECYKEAFPKEGENLNIMDFRAFRLFHDWDIWGDSTSYPELKATAVLDTSKNDPIQLLDDSLHLSTKMGTNKCIIANQDTDSQGTSKLFAFTLNINQQLKLHLNPSICRTIHFRTVDTLPWTPSMGVHWFGNGQTELLHGNVDHTSVKWPLNLLYKRVLKERNLTEMRMLQYRYNHPSKVSSVVGYLMDTKDDGFEYINHNWRIVKVTAEYDNPNPIRSFNGSTNSSTTAEVFLRNIEFGWWSKGILVDVSAAVMDANNQSLLPAFPHNFQISIFNANTNELIGQYSSSDKEEINKLFHSQAGLLLIKNRTIPDNVPLKITLSETVESTILPAQPAHQIKVHFVGVEQSYSLEIKDRFVKTQRLPVLYGQSQTQGSIDDKSTAFPMYENFIKYELNCTQYGKPFNGKLTLNLDSSFGIDQSGLSQYTRNEKYLATLYQNNDPRTIIKPPKERINNLINVSKKFSDTFKTYQRVNELVFQGKLDNIIKMTDEYVDLLFHQNQLQYVFPEGNGFKPFKLSFQPNQNVNNLQVEFKNGFASVLIYLNKDLVEKINPRHPSMESLCLIGQLKIEDEPVSCDFTALFFQNPSKDPFQRIDWQHVVGPKLKLMGLMYPSMQNIVNLYEYDGLSMTAMRRAFEIEDERHSRYMPATREMSSGTHRQIRRWLYNPIYDSQISVGNSALPPKKTNFTFRTFDEGKSQLIDLVRGAFKLELTTIALYLSAMYSITREGEATKLIRSVAKDEMKHLFIVSNILNALGETPPYPRPNSGPVDSVPSYPIQSETDIICFHFQQEDNWEWKQLMNPLPIQSSIREQLLRFVMIEMPGEAYAIKITPLLVDPQTKTYIDVTKRTCGCKTIFCKCGKVRTIPEERIYRIQLLRGAIDAVALEMAARQKQKQPQSDLTKEFMTIGMAYEKITDYLWALNDMEPVKLFSGDNAKQFTYMYLENMTEVINLRTALEQIRLITEEGEGSSMYTVTGEINKSSHFIKFIEIFTGCDLNIVSRFIEFEDSPDSHQFKREALFILTPSEERFPNFPAYTKVEWTAETDKHVDHLVNSELSLERLSDRLEHTQFPHTYAPRSFLNSYTKILEEIGFVFTTDPKKFKSGDRITFEETRLRSLENAVARMRQMTLNSTHIVHPNDTFDRKFPRHPNQPHPEYPVPKHPPPKTFPSASPKYNLKDSQWLPKPKDQ